MRSPKVDRATHAVGARIKKVETLEMWDSQESEKREDSDRNHKLAKEKSFPELKTFLTFYLLFFRHRVFLCNLG